ncbi:MAG: GNAT family N-acetyltransferase [Acidobacteriaceae bacterium]
MPRIQPLYEVERKPLEVPGLIQSVQTNADSNRDALGFLPAQAYEQAARQGTLFVAVQRRGQDSQYAGHVLFGARYPHARIFQVFVASGHRKHGIGRMLVQTLLTLWEEKQYLSATAKVASDLDANDFWQSLKFDVVATMLGGAVRGRTINVRSHQFNTPSLFGYRRPVTGIPLTEPLPNFTTILALDLNVFFDVARRRPRSEYGAVVMSAAFNNIVRLTVTQEFANELRRSARSIQDPILEFALQLPTLPALPNRVSAALIDELAALTFPARAAAGTLTVQDKSDLTHLAIAAHHKITAFVTAEDALVRASSAIETRFGIRVLHVKDLAETIKSTTSVSSPLDIGFSDHDLRLSDVTAKHAAAIRILVDSVKLPRELRGLALSEGVQASTRQSLAISFEDEVICAAFWQPQSLLQGGLEALLLVDEDQVSSLVSVNALLNRLSRIASERGSARVQIIIPNSAIGAQDVAIRYGFMRCSVSDPEVSRYQRLSIGGVVDAVSWPSARKNLQVTADMRLAEDFAAIADDELRIHFQNHNGNEFMIDLFDLETNLSPTMFLVSGRGAVLVPIRPSYADDLLGTAAQGSLLPKPQAAILHERTYFSSVRNKRLFGKGTLIVFYESGKFGGRSAAVAVARVTGTVVLAKSQIDTQLLEGGVVDEEGIKDLSSSTQIAATKMDNVMKLRKPVPLKLLRGFGCIDKANLITSRPITSDQLQKVMAEGQGTCE